MLPYVFKYKRYKRSHSSVNLFDIVLKLFFERKKSSINVAMNSQCVFRLAGVGSKMKSLPCTNTCEWISIFYCRYLDFLNVCFKCLKIRHDEWCVGQLHWRAAWVSPIRTKIKTAIFTQRTSPMKMVIYS